MKPTLPALAALTVALSSFTSVIASPARADLFGWTDPAREAVGEMIGGFESDVSGDLMSVWSAVRARRIQFDKPAYQLFHFPYDRTKTKIVPVALSLADGPAPLVILNPGLFSNPDDSIALRQLANYRKLGFHVAVLPNPWSDAYLAQAPKQNPGDLAAEARMVNRLARDIRAYIGTAQVTRTHLVGLSYGAFLSAVAMQADADSPKPVFDGEITIFSPPLRLAHGIRSLDAALDEVFEHSIHLCHAFRIKLFSDLFFLSDPRKAGFDLRACATTLLARNFQDNLHIALTTLHQAKGVGPKPPTHDDWEEEFRFSDAIDAYVPENAEYLRDHPEGTLKHWLSKTPKKTLSRLRILVADDDFMNQGIEQEWSQIPQAALESVVVLPAGGHLGFEALPGFLDVLDELF